jgi:hypothetical protein
MAGKDKLAEAPGLTDRQKAWARASDEEHDRGNEFAAGFFALLEGGQAWIGIEL